MTKEKQIFKFFSKQVLIVLLSLISIFSIAQEDSTIIVKRSNKDLIIPSSIALAGFAFQLSGQKYNFQKYFHNTIGKTETTVDDYLQYVPAAQIYAGKIIGWNGKGHWFDQSKNLFFSQALSTIVVTALKHTLKVERPHEGAHNSLPSGHTTFAFVNAENLFQIYKDSQPIYAYSGYLFATATGGLRISNDKHWAPDVLLGAGLGILLTRLIYHWEPLKNWNPFIKKKRIAFVLIPKYTNEYWGANLQISF